MPRKPGIEEALKYKWNLYLNKIDKLNYQLALTKAGKQKCQSAGVRAMMHLYTVDEQFRNRVNEIIDDFIVYKENGEQSQL